MDNLHPEAEPNDESRGASVESPEFLNGFTRIPNEIFGDSTLLATDIAVFTAVCSFAAEKTIEGKGGRACWASVRRIAIRAHLGDRAVYNSLVRLEAGGYLCRIRRGRTRTNLTYIVLNRTSFLKDRSQENEENATRNELERHRRLFELRTELAAGRIKSGAYSKELEQLGITNAMYRSSGVVAESP